MWKLNKGCPRSKYHIDEGNTYIPVFERLDHTENNLTLKYHGFVNYKKNKLNSQGHEDYKYGNNNYY